MHGTFVAGILCATRSSAAPAICPGCTLLVRPIFSETPAASELIPSATPEELAAAIIECVDAGARLVNLSAALAQVPSAKGERALTQALDHATNRGAIVVAAAGNRGTVGSTAITRHPWVIAVIACDRRGRPLNESNFGNSIGRRGLSAPGEGITSLGTDGKAAPSGGTSVAAPFVTGAIALVWSQFVGASASHIRVAISQAHTPRWRTVIPALLNAWAIYATMRESLNVTCKMKKKQATKERAGCEPYRIRLPGFVTGKEVGLGDVIKRATSAVGIRPCAGCERRAAALNRWFVFTGRH